MTDKRRVAICVVLAFGLIAAVAGAVFALVPVRADMTILIPERQAGDLALLFRSLREGPANRTVLIALSPADGPSPLRDAQRLSRAYKKALQDSGQFDLVANGEVRRDRASLEPFFRYRYRLNPPLDPGAFSEAGLRAALERLLRELHGLGGSILKEIMAADPTLRTLRVASLWAPAPMNTRQGVWVDRDGRAVLLVARTKSAGFDFAAQAAAIAALRRAADALAPDFGALRLTLSGPSVIAVESRNIAEAESVRLVLISVPLLLAVLLLFLRRPSVLPLLFLPLGCGFVAGAAAVGALFGYVHVTTLGFGVTVLGIAVDYPLHLVARVQAGRPAADAVRRIQFALLIAAATTACAFLPLVLSSFPGLAQLGVFGVAGLAAALAATRWLLPALLRTPAVPAVRTGSAALLALHRGRTAWRWLALILGAGALLFLLVRPQPVWQQDLAALSPIPEAIRTQDQILRRDLDVVDPRYILVVSGADTEEVLQRSERLLPALQAARKAGVVGAYDMAALYLSSARAQTSRLDGLPGETALRRNLEGALDGLPFRAGTFEPFLDAIAALRGKGPLTIGELSDTPLGARLAPLLLQAADGAKALILLRGLRNPAELRKTVETQGIDGVRYLDLKQSAQMLMDDYRDQTLRWVALGGSLAILLLAIMLRSLRGVAAVAVPVALSAIVTAAIFAPLAGGLSIFHLLGLLIVAGLGVDYAVFLRDAAAAGVDPADRSDSVRAVVLCATTSFSVFALLATASAPLLSQIGSTVAVGVVLALAFALVFTAPRTGGAS